MGKNILVSLYLHPAVMTILQDSIVIIVVLRGDSVDNAFVSLCPSGGPRLSLGWAKCS